MALYSVELPGGSARAGASGSAPRASAPPPPAAAAASHVEIACWLAHSFMPVPLTLAWMRPT